jgi:3-phosphoshikimate 1-carboxyvinyltransferase
MKPLPFLDLPPLAGASGTVRLPGSKSISNRVLLLAGLAAGTTTVHDLLDSDDTRVMLAALRALGCGLSEDSAAPACCTSAASAAGCGCTRPISSWATPAPRCGPLTAALAVLAATQGGRFTLSRRARMHERPIGDLVDALRPLGCTSTISASPATRRCACRASAAAGWPPRRRSACAATCRASS